MRSKERVFLASGIILMLAGQTEWQAWGQANRAQAPPFEPDPLWAEALPNK